MTTTREGTAALDITRGIIHDQRINPTWSPTDSQIDRRISNYCDEGDPLNPIDRDRVRTLIDYMLAD